MDMRNFEQCRVMTKSPSWTFIDVFRWKVLPEKFGGGRSYARNFKDTWVKKHRLDLSACSCVQPLKLWGWMQTE